MFFSENDLSLELLGVFKLTRTSQSIQSNNSRNYDSISLRINGNSKFQVENRCLIVKRGDLLYLPKNAQYSSETYGETIFAIHFINYSFSNKNQIEILSVEDFEKIESLVVEMYKEWKEKRPGYRYKCTSLFYSLMYHLSCQTYANTLGATRCNEKFKIAADYIHAHYRSEHISVSSLARMCAVSETYFRKQFRKLYSQSPSQYIINLRLEFASQLLSSGLYTITETAEKSGFNDTKYFSRLFKKRYHRTPQEYQSLTSEPMIRS